MMTSLAYVMRDDDKHLKSPSLPSPVLTNMRYNRSRQAGRQMSWSFMLAHRVFMANEDGPSPDDASFVQWLPPNIGSRCELT